MPLKKNGSFAYIRDTDKNTMSGLTVEKIIEIHDDIIVKFDGANGVLSLIHSPFPGLPCQ
jgi:hypothetical protein